MLGTTRPGPVFSLPNRIQEVLLQGPLKFTHCRHRLNRPKNQGTRWQSWTLYFFTMRVWKSSAMIPTRHQGSQSTRVRHWRRKMLKQEVLTSFQAIIPLKMFFSYLQTSKSGEYRKLRKNIETWEKKQIASYWRGPNTNVTLIAWTDMGLSGEWCL